MSLLEPVQPSAPEPQILPDPLRQALEALVSRAPHPLFPKARRLYFDKYPLEGHPDTLNAAVDPVPYRTYLLRETLIEPEGESLSERLRLEELALVHWQAETIDQEQASAYLRQVWHLEGATVSPESEAWFREGGAWLRITLPGAPPVPVPADPEPSP
jgi:hypothetical protein